MRPVESVEPACSASVSIIIKNNLAEPPLNFQVTDRAHIFLNYHLLFSGFLGKKYLYIHTHTHKQGICLSLAEPLINPVLIHLPNCAFLFPLSSFCILQLLHWVGGLEGKHIHYVASKQDGNHTAGNKIKFTAFPCTCHKLLI